MKRSRSQANITVSAAPPPKRKRSTKITRFPRNGISASARATLKYACEVSVTTPGVSTVARHIFAVNGLYDPDNTGGGTQPQGFDEWMTLYNLYTVVGGKVKMTPVNNSVNAASPAYFAMGISDGQILSSATVQTLLTASNNQANKAAPYSAIGIHKGFQSTGEVGFSRTVKWAAKDIMGVKSAEEILNRQALQGSSSGNPSDLIYGTLAVGDVSGGSAVTCAFMVEIEFDVIFTNPKQLTMS